MMTNFRSILARSVIYALSIVLCNAVSFVAGDNAIASVETMKDDTNAFYRTKRVFKKKEGPHVYVRKVEMLGDDEYYEEDANSYVDDDEKGAEVTLEGDEEYNYGDDDNSEGYYYKEDANNGDNNGTNEGYYYEDSAKKD